MSEKWARRPETTTVMMICEYLDSMTGWGGVCGGCELEGLRFRIHSTAVVLLGVGALCSVEHRRDNVVVTAFYGSISVARPQGCVSHFGVGICARCRYK